MILLRLISWPYVRRHGLRTALTITGIVLGVAVFVAMNAANQSMVLAFSNTVDRIAGRTELQISAGETGFPEAVLEQVQAASSVRVAVPVIEAVVRTNLPGHGNLLVLGVDLTGDRTLRGYEFESGDEALIDDPLVFLAQPDSIIVSSEFARRHGAGLGSQVPLGTVDGDKHVTIRGIMKPAGLASAFGGNLAVMDIYAAQRMFGRGQTFDRIDLALVPGRTIAEGRRELETRLGPGFQVDPPSSRGQQFEAMIASYSLMMGASSLLALFIGIFIIYNAFAIAVTQRRSEIGIMRALGASQSQIRRLFLGESLMMGLAGSVVGVLAGVLLARGVAASTSALVSDVFGTARDTSPIEIDLALLATAMVIGVTTSVVAALIPSQAAARADPVQALQKGTYQSLSARAHGMRVWVAAALVVASGGLLLGTGTRPLFYVSYLLVIGAALLLVPLLSQGLAKSIRPLLKQLRPVEGTLAVDSLIASPRRTSATVAALTLSVALVIAFGGMARASYASITDWLNGVINPDLFVTPAPTVVDRTMRFPSSMISELASIPGIRRVQPVRQARIIFRELPVMLVAVELSSIRETTRVRAVAGNVSDMFRSASQGQGLMVSENLAELHRLRHGELIELAAPGGLISLPIVGVIVDYSDQQGAILIDRSVFQRYWRDDSVNVFRVYLQAGAALDDVKERILNRYAGTRQVFVLNNEDLREYILGITNQWFQMTYVQVAVAVIVAILGIVNTLTVSITDRRRELGILRAVGAVQQQVRLTIWIEALSTAALGIALGCALGALNLSYVLEMVRQDVAGIRLAYQFPAAIALLTGSVILCAAFLAALWPAASAAKGSLVEALEYE